MSVTRVVAALVSVLAVGATTFALSGAAGATVGNMIESAPTPVAVEAPIEVVPGPTTSTTETPAPVDPAAALRDVTTAQHALSDAGYWLGDVDGQLGTDTKQALLAFQKVNGLPLTSALDDATVNALVSIARPAPIGTGGDRIEIDKSRQVIFVVRGNEVRYVFNTSTGSEQAYSEGGQTGTAHTPTGSFTVFREVNRTDPGPLGNLYRPKYFTDRGHAIHGAESVPAYAASHGCARVTNDVMNLIWSEDLMPLGTQVVITGTTPER